MYLFIVVCILRLTEEPRPVQRQQADPYPPGEFGRERADNRRHLLLPRLIQRVRDQVHASVWPAVSVQPGHRSESISNVDIMLNLARNQIYASVQSAMSEQVDHRLRNSGSTNE